jgi:hypothetical protein
MEESFVAPLAVPKLPPNRMYFCFGEPIVTKPEDKKARLGGSRHAAATVGQQAGAGERAQRSLPLWGGRLMGAAAPAAAQDRARCDELYRQTRQSVEDGIAYLLRRRDADPYRNFAVRSLYEAATGRQAPTFPLD